MITIPVQLTEELAERVRPVQDRLPEIIELGLRQWRKQPAPTPRQRVEQLWEAQGLVEPAVQSGKRSRTTRRQRQAPIPAGANPPARSLSSSGARYDRQACGATSADFVSGCQRPCETLPGRNRCRVCREATGPVHHR